MESNKTQNFFTNQSLNNNKLTISAKCIQGQFSNLACNNSHCKQYAFVCNNKNCQCRLNHKKCLFTCSDQILEIIEQKKSQSSVIIDKVCSIFDVWIDQISKTRQQIQSILLNWGLSNKQKEFLDLIKKQDYSKLTGGHINKITTQTTAYFEQEVKQKLISQIQKTAKNYDSQIKRIMSTFASHFNSAKIDQNLFKKQQEIVIQKQFNFMNEAQQFRSNKLRKTQGKYQKKDFDNLCKFIKDSVQNDFYGLFCKYKKSRRVYSNKQLREKYFDDYLLVLAQAQKHIEKFKSQTQSKIKTLNRTMEKELRGLSQFYREYQSQIQRPFTPEMALALQRFFQTIYLLTDFIRQNGQEMLIKIIERGRPIKDNMILAIYFLDGLMDEHPEIDQVQIFWIMVRFELKIKNEVDFLFETINQITKQAYHVQVLNQ